MKNKLSYLLALTLVTGSLFLAGCNTWEGMKQDTEEAAEEIDEEI